MTPSAGTKGSSGPPSAKADGRGPRRMGPGLWRGHLAALRVILIACMAALTLSISTEVVTRYFFGFSIFAIEDFAKFVAVYMYFIGAAHGVWQKEVVSRAWSSTSSARARSDREPPLRQLATLATPAAFVWSWDYLVFTFGRQTRSVELGIHLTGSTRSSRSAWRCRSSTISSSTSTGCDRPRGAPCHEHSDPCRRADPRRPRDPRRADRAVLCRAVLFLILPATSARRASSSAPATRRSPRA